MRRRDRHEAVPAARLDGLRACGADGVVGPRAWAKLGWYALGSPGMMRKIFAAWVAYFLPGFHPWNMDDRALIADYEAMSGAAFDSAKKVRRAA